MAVTTTQTNKPFNPRGNDQSPKGYNRAALYSGKALDFDGVNDYVDCGTLDVTAYTGISMSFSFQLANITDNGLRLVSLLHSNLDDIRIEQGLSVLRITLDDGTAYTLETPSLTANEWNKFDMTFNGTTLEGYINGVSIGSISASFDFSTANGLLNLYKHSAASSYAEGSMSGFKLFNTALTAAQVADLYNNPEKVVPTGVDNTALKLWLPMQEGAGTTAYDGSGNGNHGTISGATWTHGIGAPVAQTAVIDWNKGTNLLPYSEEFDQWTKNNTSVSDNVESAPNGTTTADKWIINNGQPYGDIRQTISSSVGQNYLIFVFVKADEFDRFQLDTSNSQFSDVNAEFNVTNGTIVSSGGDNVTEGIIDKGNGWYLCYIVGTAISTSGSFIIRNDINGTQTGDGSKGMYLWGGGYVQASDITPYIPTIGNTTQTSEVLLPQGLTSGRDITGVNLFENVRKQGALNLDGNSWAEVHDNASLDVTTAVTLEAWIRCGDELDSVYNHIFVKQSGTTWAPPYGVYSLRLRKTSVQWWFNSYTSQKDYAVSLSGWNHLVATKNGTSEVLYLNGVQVDTNTGAATITASAYSLLIGSRTAYDSAEMIDNQLAQPRIYNRALTAEEVQRNYNAGKNIYTN